MIQLLTFATAISVAVLAEAAHQLYNVVDEQEMCHYPTHIKCWTPWFENPSGTIDKEAMVNLRLKNPGKICPTPVEIEISNTISLGPPGDLDTAANMTSSICQSQPSFCQEYSIHFNRVRFSCHPPFCKDKDEQFYLGRVCWTIWLNRDTPRIKGDSEDFAHLKSDYKNIICDTPLFIEGVTRDEHIPATETGDYFLNYSPTEGLVCRNNDQKQKSCQDYIVRFGCPCKN
ncbi:uncharacterized protein LOC115356303 isoform X2 [Myripristis murdjan]|uniref:uncharacterized protein LOC115356303 isoform X2 n=1 Tax=Myripristis murdjan TaxID=586833 RepID=UPI0011761FA0|nr:uncharacterized protein LOC115356303 isoform X2 [Myripristis murdjan]